MIWASLVWSASSNLDSSQRMSIIFSAETFGIAQRILAFSMNDLSSDSIGVNNCRGLENQQRRLYQSSAVAFGFLDEKKNIVMGDVREIDGMSSEGR